jgi:hypothetical protein
VVKERGAEALKRLICRVCPRIRVYVVSVEAVEAVDTQLSIAYHRSGLGQRDPGPLYTHTHTQTQTHTHTHTNTHTHAHTHTHTHTHTHLCVYWCVYIHRCSLIGIRTLQCAYAAAYIYMPRGVLFLVCFSVQAQQ